MGLIGLFIAFRLGWRILLAHSVYALFVVAAFTIHALIVDHASMFELYIYVAPVISVVVIAPTVIQVVIEAGRRSLRFTAIAALRDPLTGLANRRSMSDRTHTMLRR